MKILYRAWIFICILALFSGCDNFLEGAQIKQDIEDQIYIANHESPVATVEEPAFSDQGVSKNRAIIISFTQSMNPETLKDALSINDAQGNSLLYNFTTPIWSNDNKLVTIPANERNLIDLQGNSTKDIYVTLSKSCRTTDKLPIKDEISHKYRIRDTIDNTAPMLSLVRGELPPEYIGQDSSAETTLLSDADFTAETEETIITTNHINSKANFYIEGNDYGGGDVYAHFKYSRIYDVSGESVHETNFDKRIRLSNVNTNGNSFDTVCLDISDSTAKDGIYKVTVSVSDVSNLDSNESKIYYLLRDTTLADSANSLIWFETPQFRNDFAPGVQMYFPSFDLQAPTIDKIEYFMSRIQFAFLSDDVFYISNVNKEEEIVNGNTVLVAKSYKTQQDNYSYYISWGTDLNNDMSIPVRIEGYDETDPEKYGDHSWLNNSTTMKVYNIPDGYRQYQTQHTNKDIYVKTTIYDAVGNSNSLITLVPKQVEFYGYKVSAGTSSDKKKITLSYYDLSGLGKGLTDLTYIPDKDNYALYRIYYGKIEDGMDESDIRGIELKRNTVKPLNEDNSSNIPDKKELEVEAGSKYIFYIQPNYNMNSLTNERWCGQTFGKPYKVIVDTNVSMGGSIITEPTFTCEKKSAELNTSLFNINIKVENPQPGVKYVPCYSTDNGNNWSYFESHSESTFSFQVKNPLKAPFETNWKNSNFWKDYDNGNSYFESVKNCRENNHYPDITAKIKILAISDAGSAESNMYTINFSEDDDNIPPMQASELSSHDSWLDFDGHSFKFEKIAREDEGHMSKYFNYYYMPYSSAWGDNLSLNVSPTEIERLPGGTGVYTSTCWFKDWYDGNNGEAPLGTALYGLTMNIPLNGIADGKYMAFAKVFDTYGNCNYITLGKMNVGTFKNKLKVYSKKNSSGKWQLISSLPIESEEKSFKRNMINIQSLGTTSGTSNAKWYNKYGDGPNELQDCGEATVIDGKNVIHYETPTTPSDDFVDWNGNMLGQEKLKLDARWYRITMQSFNEDPLVGEEVEDAFIVEKNGVNKIYGRPYSREPYTHPITYKYLQNESKYDLCTEETVSNTVYHFIPYYDNYLDDIKSSFFPSTATVRSNKTFLVNVISAARDLGSDPDEWERRGKLIQTHYYNPGDTNHPETQFNESVAADDMFNSNEKGLVYYVAVVHFADGKMAISKTYTMQGI